MEEKKQPRKYQRREFIKNTAKIGAGAAIWGGIGYFVGKGYKSGRDSYRNNVKPYFEKGKELIDEAGQTKDRLGDWWDKYFNKKEYAKQQQEKLGQKKRPKEPEKTSRRGFLSKYFGLFNEHPVGTGTVTGVALGGLIKSLKIYPQYLEKKKVAKLRDEHIEYGERLRILEEYKENLEIASQNKDQKIKGLEDELAKIYEKLNMNEKDSSGLENKLETDSLETPISMFLSGIGLIIGFVLINGVNYTGFSVLSKDYMTPSNFLGVIIVFTSLILIILGGIGIRKIEKARQIPKKKKHKKKNN